MKWHADSVSQIGSTHLTRFIPNQDYALNNSSDSGNVFALALDGCSSGGETDIGARVMAKNLEKALLAAERIDPEVIINSQQGCLDIARELRLDRSDLLATRLVAWANHDNSLGFHVTGGGVVAIRYFDGSLLLKRFSWSNNTPYYWIYGDTEREFFAADSEIGWLKIEVFSVGAEGDICLVSEEEHKGKAALCYTQVFSPDEATDVQALAVMSDGVEQIQEQSWQDVAVSLLNCRTWRGEFIRRRLRSVLRQYKKGGFEPLDDISVAVITATENS